MIRFRVLVVSMLIGTFASALAGADDSSNEFQSHPSTSQSPAKPQIELGFNLLYGLNFTEAHKQFAAWKQLNPEDPLGCIATAASYLFEEFYEQEVLTSKFFLDDKRLLGGIQGKPDEGRIGKFRAENRQGRELAQRRIRAEPRDADALFALAISNGLEANFAAIIEKRQMESLSLIRKADDYATQLLALKPDEADAWFSLGAANYIIGSLPAYKRFFLWFGGIHGDIRLGMEQMRITAEKGHYLKPFAEIFLALAAIREKQEELARGLLQDLAAQFPENPLYQAELARLGNPYERSKNGGH